MKKPIPFRALRKEAGEIFAGLCDNYWTGQNGRAESFSFWAGWNTLSIRVQNGNGLTDETSYRHYLELAPKKRQAVFYEHCGLPETRRVVEERLIAKGYAISQKGSEWFNMNGRERSHAEQTRAPSPALIAH